MRIRVATVLAVLVLLGLAASAGAQQLDGARPGSTLGGPAPGPDGGSPQGCISQGFDDITALPGWFTQNNSQPIGTTNWFQGNPAVFPAHSGAPASYIGANFNNVAGTGTISNWLLTPELDLASIDTLSFFTRGPTGSTFPDRLEVRYSTAGASTNVGTLATDVGVFTNLILEINPTQSIGGYPQIFTQFTFDNTDIVAGASGRVAFRYFVTSAGPTGNFADFIGIDTFEFCALQEADLAIAKSCSVAGDVVTCDLDVENLGPASATNVVVTDTIPTGLTWVSDTCGAGPPAGQTLTWSVGTLNAGASATCSVSMTVVPGTIGDLINVATVTADNADPTGANNTSQVVIGVGSVLEIPTLSSLGLIALVVALALASVVLLRRRFHRA